MNTERKGCVRLPEGDFLPPCDTSGRNVDRSVTLSTHAGLVRGENKRVRPASDPLRWPGEETHE
jgi:hypothetical protein